MTGINLDFPSLLILSLPLLLLMWLWRVSKSWVMRLLYTSIPLGVVVFSANKAIQNNEAESREASAMAALGEHCKKSGLKINRTVEGVRGIALLRWRGDEMNWGTREGDQFRLDDPYGGTCVGEVCIEYLLRVTSGFELDPQRELGKYPDTPYEGYEYLETVDPKDGQMYRYTRRLEISRIGKGPKPALVKTKIKRLSVRYGITWDDLSTREDRERWTAGSSLSIVDIETKEVLAERIVYMLAKVSADASYRKEVWLDARRYACGNIDVPATEISGLGYTSEMRTFAVLALKYN